MTISLGTGCTAILTWIGARVEITILAPGGRIARRLRGDWTPSAIRSSDIEVRRIAEVAVRSGRAPALLTSPARIPR